MLKQLSKEIKTEGSINLLERQILVTVQRLIFQVFSLILCESLDHKSINPM